MKQKRNMKENNVLWGITNTIRDSVNPEEITEAAVITAYLLYENSQSEKKHNFGDILNGKLGIEEDALLIAKEFLTEEKWQSLVETAYDPEELKHLIMYDYSETRKENRITDYSEIQIAANLLDIKDRETVADLGCGYGGFLTYVANWQSRKTELYGYDISAYAIAIAKIRARLTGKKINIHLCNALSLLSEENRKFLPENGFDKIFSNYPFGQRARKYEDLPGVKLLTKHFASLKKANSADWLFNAIVAELLNENGRGICITTKASTWNALDREVRKQFVEEGLIEAVITLPSLWNIPKTIPACMMVISRGNWSIRMIDAEDLLENGNDVYSQVEDDEEYKEYEDDPIGRVFKEYYEGGFFSDLSVSLDDIRREDYCLYPGRYLQTEEKGLGGEPFSNIITRITRGAPISPGVLKEQTTPFETNCRYISIGNISDGFIDDYLPGFEGYEKKLEKYCLKDESLILSKVGYPFKLGLANVEEGENILANGNLYIIDIDREKADPVYVKAYLESERGQAMLKTASSGMTVMTIGAEALKRILIPLPPLEKQKKIREAYLAAQDEVQITKLRYETAKTKLRYIFDSMWEG